MRKSCAAHQFIFKYIHICCWTINTQINNRSHVLPISEGPLNTDPVQPHYPPLALTAPVWLTICYLLHVCSTHTGLHWYLYANLEKKSNSSRRSAQLEMTLSWSVVLKLGSVVSSQNGSGNKPSLHLQQRIMRTQVDSDSFLANVVRVNYKSQMRNCWSAPAEYISVFSRFKAKCRTRWEWPKNRTK